MITLDISHIAQLLTAQFLDTANVQDAKTLLPAGRGHALS